MHSGTEGFIDRAFDDEWAGERLQSVVDRFDAMARRYPDHPAVFEWVDGSDALVSYSELKAWSSQLAGVLPLDSARPGRVGILIGNAIGHLTALLGILRAGHAAVPVEPSTPPERLRFILEHADVALVVSDQASEDLARTLSSEVLGIDEVDSASTPYEGPGPSLSSTAQILYTSGSTGKPKGVVQSHRYLMEKTRSETGFYRFHHDDRLSQLFPLSFAASNGHTFGALLNGGTLFRYDISERGIHHLADWVQRHRISGLAGVPTLFRRALAGVDDPEKFRSVRFLMVGGEMVLPADQVLLLGLLGDEAVVIHRLAATEVGEIARIPIDRETPRFQTAVPAGKPPPDKELVIVAEDGTPVPDGEVGELWVRSRFLSEGYWGDDELTARTFSEDADGVRTYRTGDLARREPDGYIFHLGRKDDRVKVRGFAVDLVEVESVLLSIEGIAEGAIKAFDRPDGDTLLVGYYRLVTDLTPAQVRDQMSKTVPEYMIPSVLVPMEGIPLTPRGKIDRQALPDPALFSRSAGGAPPETDLQQKLHELWTRALGIDTVGADESFFHLGGTSIQAYNLIADIFRELKVDIPASTLLEAPTIADQARLIESGRGRSARSLVPIRESGPNLPLFGIHGVRGGIIFLHRLAEQIDARHPIYALQPEMRENVPPVYQTVEEMAAHYLDEVRSVQPDGPYLLLGSCFGGLVAREMARLLEEGGQPVALLVMVDPPTPGPIPDRPGDPWSWLKVRRGIDSKVRKGFKRMRRVWRRLRPSFAAERGRQLGGMHRRARIEYRPSPSQIPVLVLASQGSAARHRENWARVSPGGLEVEEFPAFHPSMWDGANRRVIAGILNDRLQRLGTTVRA